MGIISKYNRMTIPRGIKNFAARTKLAHSIRKQRAVLGRKVVRSKLIHKIRENVEKASGVHAKKMAKLKKTSHTMTIQASIKKKRARYKGEKATSILAGAGGGRKPRGHKAELLKTFQHMT